MKNLIDTIIPVVDPNNSSDPNVMYKNRVGVVFETAF